MRYYMRGKISGDCGGWTPPKKPVPPTREEEEFIKSKEMEIK